MIQNIYHKPVSLGFLVFCSSRSLKDLDCYTSGYQPFTEWDKNKNPNLTNNSYIGLH